MKKAKFITLILCTVILLCACANPDYPLAGNSGNRPSHNATYESSRPKQRLRIALRPTHPPKSLCPIRKRPGRRILCLSTRAVNIPAISPAWNSGVPNTNFKSDKRPMNS